MNYVGLIIKNPFRNKTRTSLAIIGIAIGIATIVALGLVTGGLKESTESTLKAGGAEITVIQAGTDGFLAGNVQKERITDIQNINGIQDTAGVLRTSVRLENGSSSNFGPSGFIVNGMEVTKLNLAGIESIDGAYFSDDDANEIIIGKTAAQNLNKTVGDSIKIFNEDFKITGIFETGNIITDAGAYLSLSKLQQLTNTEDKVSIILVKINENANATQVGNDIEEAYPDELATTSAADQIGRINQGLSFIDTATWAISLLAIVIGGVGVINTMIMSVYERTREIGVLKAVGWRSRRILGMILGESIVITLLAALVGIVVGIIGVELLLSLTTETQGIIQPAYSLELFARALGIAFLVGIIGGIYPAYRASRLAPTEALRYE
ncbi:ABC transporter permease [Methanobacterium alkalithermotolerans]|uniref:ABC transporter permease n=1 Tax=Methanobacterium alkalithermotolerans TaxID=2731220 RepID=A0A8T8K6P8_9EURY|nr:ABC transporter permease [Methanobacterium alkalithermotolerans]QUH23492.1 ABC transporter permease [Methanobacterium alkalithermotolerans]